jgi:curli biogenesis system outer membrane secretion channel CsgG
MNKKDFPSHNLLLVRVGAVLLLCLTLSASVYAQGARSLKRKVAIARFTNETTYAKGIFYDKENRNPIEKQAADILATKLAATEKFILIERQDFDKIQEELKLGGLDQQKVNADYLIIGSVTEFGRSVTGDEKVFSRSKTQKVNAAISVRLVDVSTGQIIYSEEAKGEAETSAKQTLGYGKTADYDASLDDKAISAAVSKLVENIMTKCMDRPWKSYFIAVEEGTYIISGGNSQGLRVGDQYIVMQKGKTAKNPQTGMLIELPGKLVGKIKIESLGGETVDSEFAIVSFTEGSIDTGNLLNYFIIENKQP